MTTRVQPGLAFSIVCDLGFAVGLVTHYVPRIGHLVWLAAPIYDEPPDLVLAASIDAWRWPVFFPLAAAVRRRLVTPLGAIDIPASLAQFPRMRSGNKQLGWREFRYVDGGEREQAIERFGPATDPRLPIDQIVNDTMLKEMLVTSWTPERNW